VADAQRRDTVWPGAGAIALAGGRRELASRGELDGLEEYIGFRAHNELFALPLSLVREIQKVPPITEVPRARADILGIVSIRGQVTTVIDLRRRLDFTPGEQTAHTRILLVEGGEEVVGLMVDEVTQVYRLSDAEIEPAGSVLGGNLASHVAGVGRPRVRGLRGDTAQSSDEVLILLDLGALLAI
jgi:purine-binding chemotaxis protein CheW